MSIACWTVVRLCCRAVPWDWTARRCPSYWQSDVFDAERTGQIIDRGGGGPGAAAPWAWLTFELSRGGGVDFGGVDGGGPGWTVRGGPDGLRAHHPLSR